MYSIPDHTTGRTNGPRHCRKSVSRCPRAIASLRTLNHPLTSPHTHSLIDTDITHHKSSAPRRANPVSRSCLTTDPGSHRPGAVPPPLSLSSLAANGAECGERAEGQKGRREGQQSAKCRVQRNAPLQAVARSAVHHTPAQIVWMPQAQARTSPNHRPASSSHLSHKHLSLHLQTTHSTVRRQCGLAVTASPAFLPGSQSAAAAAGCHFETNRISPIVCPPRFEPPSHIPAARLP